MMNHSSKTKPSTPRNYKTKKIINTERSRDSSVNTFLEETNRNSDINDSVRLEIEERFQKSNTNSTYRFPRTHSSKKLLKPKLSNKKKGNTPVRVLKKFRVYKQVTVTDKLKDKNMFFKTHSPNGVSINLKKLISHSSSALSPRRIKKIQKSARGTTKASK